MCTGARRVIFRHKQWDRLVTQVQTQGVYMGWQHCYFSQTSARGASVSTSTPPAPVRTAPYSALLGLLCASSPSGVLVLAATEGWGPRALQVTLGGPASP